ncbi:hypothetical protein F5X96DRAFT_624357, partial [Biscogniauxia mediterranea]
MNPETTNKSVQKLSFRGLFFFFFFFFLCEKHQRSHVPTFIRSLRRPGRQPSRIHQRNQDGSLPLAIAIPPPQQSRKHPPPKRPHTFSASSPRTRPSRTSHSGGSMITTTAEAVQQPASGHHNQQPSCKKQRKDRSSNNKKKQPNPSRASALVAFSQCFAQHHHLSHRFTLIVVLYYLPPA